MNDSFAAFWDQIIAVWQMSLFGVGVDRIVMAVGIIPAVHLVYAG